MIAPSQNGHPRKVNGKQHELLQRIVDLDNSYFERRAERDAQPKNSYAAGQANRMNPVPSGIDPYGTDADYHYRTEWNYFLMVERGRAAVRNHPLVEQGINRLIANLKLDDFTIDVDSGDPDLDKDLKAKWYGWCEDPKACDYEQTRSFYQIAKQSFFSQVADGDISHVPLLEGSLQSWESHHIRTPWGHRPTGSSTQGIIHGAEVRDGRTVAYWVTPHNLLHTQSLTQRSKARRFPVFDSDGNKIFFWNGFTHRFQQRRGISRLSPPRDAMTGFDDLNYANIKSSLRRALISYLMESQQQVAPKLPLGGGASLPQAGSRYSTNDVGLGLEAVTFEQMGEPAQAFKTPEGYSIKGWNANLPSDSFFEHASLMLTMLAVNLDIPLSFLLLDGSLVNFHGGRMTFDQAKLRFQQLQRDQIQGLHAPCYRWKVRQWITPGSPHFDRSIAAAAARGANPFSATFRPRGWPYVKPAEDAAAEDLAERRNLRSLRSILADRGIDHDEHMPEVIRDRGRWARRAIQEAIAIRDEFPDAEINVAEFFRELWYGQASNVAQPMAAQIAEQQATQEAARGA